MSLPLCTNAGLLIVDILHHYLFYYIVPIIVLMECMVVGKLFALLGWLQQSRKVNKRSQMFFTASFWFLTVIFAVLTYFVFQFLGKRYMFLPILAWIFFFILATANA